MIQRQVRVLFMLVLTVVLFTTGGGYCRGGTGIDIMPCNPDATEETREVLAFLGSISSGETRRIISGQNCGHGNEIAHGSYDLYFETLHKQTGQYPGMIGIDYEFQREFTLAELLEANVILKDHWTHGGWVTINWAPDNPWGPSRDWKDIRTRYPGTNLNALIKPGTAIYDNWMSRLDKLAAALQDLRDAGVVVLWRPMQEMNGTWFWWGKDNFSNPHPAYIKVWRHMYNYFTNVKGLNNLLWVFSPAKDPAFASFPYPGDEYVDIVGPTQYSDTVTISGYQAYLRYNKPVGMAECGPVETNPLVVNGTFDNRLYATKFQQNYPRIAYWVTWHSWDGVKMAIVDNQYAHELMNDPYLLNRGFRP